MCFDNKATKKNTFNLSEDEDEDDDDEDDDFSRKKNHSLQYVSFDRGRS